MPDISGLLEVIFIEYVTEYTSKWLFPARYHKAEHKAPGSHQEVHKALIQ